MFQNLTDPFILANSKAIPCLGFGTWKTPDGDDTYNSVKTALQMGYRHIDTAAIYENEVSVGRGIADSGVPREEIFLTSKLWNDERGYESTLAAFEKTLSDLGTDYLDLYLIHWPAAPHKFENWKELNSETWRAFEKLYKEGRIKAIGLSNFLPHHVDALLETAEIMPMVNQIEFHPGYMQQEAVAYSVEHKMLVEAWSPLGNGRVLADPMLAELAEKYGRSVAQICLRWVLQHGVLPLSKSVTASRIEENKNIFDFEISAEDMARIDAMPETGFSRLHPDRNKF